VRWLFCDHGHGELIWDTHCNSAHSRWILRHHGIRIAGLPAVGVIKEPDFRGTPHLGESETVALEAHGVVEDVPAT
jgi:hypothetical protein